ncbi:MAG: VanZ family protein [Flavobacteriaceae bacterium]|nr:VanZ family protein [Bacteroidia bacterium]MBT8286969.1 VanZ family protein [Bacteroidia bacterium]NNF75062.1 VanZ family protein [Flavobacteriaceae bacterium]NNK72818.1 VanZ family protein [Flavobacteriaceae bacterium]
MDRKIAVLIAIGYTVALTIASLITLKGVPELGTSIDDKLYHVIAYILLIVLWYNTLKNPIGSKKLIRLTLGCIAFGIIIEAIQGKVNINRVGDILDIAANMVGIFLGLLYSIYGRKMLS